MSRELHSGVISRYFGEAWNQSRVDLLDELLHPDYVNHCPVMPDQPRGVEASKQFILTLRAALPDLRFEIQDEIHDGDRVAVRCVWRATHEGVLFGIAPTGRRLEVDQMQILRFHDGKIVEHWIAFLFTAEERDRLRAVRRRAADLDAGEGRLANELHSLLVLKLASNAANDPQFPSAPPSSSKEASGSFLLRTLASTGQLKEHLRGYLRGAFVNGAPEMKHAARHMGVGTRTLQRRLHGAGTSFTQEVDDARRELACQYVQAGDRPLREIALRLGFVNVGSFFRAFRRWTQMSPRQFRLRSISPSHSSEVAKSGECPAPVSRLVARGSASAAVTCM